MVATQPSPVKRLITAKDLATAAQHGTGLDLRGLDFAHAPSCTDRALVRAMASGLVAYHRRGNEWLVPSVSQPGTIHSLYVWQDNGTGRRIACDCEAGKAKRTCQHAALVAHELDRQAAEEVAF